MSCNSPNSKAGAEQRDHLYATPLGDIADFSFNESVAAVFPDMLRRSIPGYELVVAETGRLSRRFVTPGSHCYDLGCSTGATSMAIRACVNDARLFAIDNSPAMTEKFLERLAVESGSHSCPINVLCEDITKTNIDNASFVALNFTLQFVPPEERSLLIKTIYDGMLPGGALVLSEKVIQEDKQLETLFVEHYHAFKRANGYSELEINQKRKALENVLKPDTLSVHCERLVEAGFRGIEVWFRYFNFISLIALK